MNVSSLEFVVAVFVAATFFPLIPNSRLRQFALAVCNGIALWLMIPNGSTWAALAAFLLSGYGAGVALTRWPSRNGLVAYFGVLTFAFVVLKKYAALAIVFPASLFEHPIAIVGLSYIFFRQIHFVVDAMQGQLKDVSLWAYLNYQLNLFTILSGPIQRYQDFADYWAEPAGLSSDRHEVLKAIIRIFVGTIKLSFIAVVCLDIFTKLASTLDQASAGVLEFPTGTLVIYFVAMFYMYPAFIYFNFSGYCDVVIGSGRLLGMNLPENFDRPWLSRNMLDFWTREHRSLSFWIRDYLFTPMYKGIAERWPKRAASLAFLCYFAALFLAGVWHGATLNFVIFGLLHALGVSVNKLWERHVIKTRGRSGFREYMKSPRIRFASIVATIHFVCLTLLFFPADLDRTFRILELMTSLIA